MCGIDLLADSVPPSVAAIPPPPCFPEGGDFPDSVKKNGVTNLKVTKPVKVPTCRKLNGGQDIQ